MKKNLLLKWSLLFAFAPFAILSAQDDDELLDMSFEDLMNMEITSVSKKSERLQDVPSSIYVITQDDIQRSSSQNLMQLLREHVPGYWAVANDYMNSDALIRNTNEGSVLVLLDGTPMFGQLFSSFDFENFDIPFEHIDRIEVIKGSGGTVYGANSATGVVSIFTKDPEKNSKFFASADYAYPGKAAVNFIGTPVKSEKFGTSIYGKYSSFSGFDQIPEVTNETSTVPRLYGSGDTTITNRFTKDDNIYSTSALGLNLDYQITDKLALSTDLHYNYFSNSKYYQYLPPENAILRYAGDPSNPQPYAPDSVAYKSSAKSRLVANVQLDYRFSTKHNVFARVATNRENSDFSYGGGFKSQNNIVDFEIQGNLDFPYNSISLGGNYRNVNYDLSNFNEISQVYYRDSKNTEALTGLFIQDKIALMGGMLNLYVGLKAENFTLIDDNFYLSPMAKFTVLPNDNITIWGGYSKSFTTPGYNQTNIEYNFFRAESPKAFYDFAYPLVNLQTFFALTESGMSPEDATNYLASPEGQYLLDSLTTQEVAPQEEAFPGHYNVAAINSPNTKPTSFDNFELGFRINGGERLSFESNFFYSIMKDGIGNSPTAVDYVASQAHPGEYIDAFYYGNYFEGTNMGLESVVKLLPTSDFMIELSHSWFKYTLEYQVNDDFDIYSQEVVESTDKLVLDKYKQIPEHVLKAKFYYSLNQDWKFSITTMYASPFYVRFGTIEPTYQQQNQRFDALYGDGGNQTQIGGKHDSRLVLNFRVDKFFLDKKLGVFIYGNDITAGAFTEGVNQFETIYPRQVGTMIGAGVSYRLK